MSNAEEKMCDLTACFTPYDIRGQVPETLNVALIRRIGLAWVAHYQLEKVVIGRDVRASSPAFAEALGDALTAVGVDLIDLGLCGTEEVYYAVFNGIDEGIDGGVMVTASHNPADYNGLKMVVKGARPVSNETGLLAIRAQVADQRLSEADIACPQAPGKGRVTTIQSKASYINHLLSWVDPAAMSPLRLVVNGGNGCAGPVVDCLEAHLPFELIKLQHEPDASFPQGVPNPLLPEKREITARGVQEHQADLGIAWDGDCDRCFFFDEKGHFVEGYYMVGLLAQAALRRFPGGKVLHDPRLFWNTQELVAASGGEAIICKTGHAFIKEKMRAENAIYGGEMSAHHYFRDFGYCDSGMIPWLLVCQLISESGLSLSQLVSECRKKFPVSGEINSRVADPDAVIEKIATAYRHATCDELDGLGVVMSTYRFNVRKSNTEPVLRLNVETRGDEQLLAEKTAELLAMIRAN